MAEWPACIVGLAVKRCWVQFPVWPRYLDLFHGTPEFNFSVTFVNSQLVCLRPVGILKNVVQVELFVSVVCLASLAFVINCLR